jgi:hypothetical protein
MGAFLLIWYAIVTYFSTFIKCLSFTFSHKVDPFSLCFSLLSHRLQPRGHRGSPRLAAVEHNMLLLVVKKKKKTTAAGAHIGKLPVALCMRTPRRNYGDNSCCIFLLSNGRLSWLVHTNMPTRMHVIASAVVSCGVARGWNSTGIYARRVALLRA